MNIFQRQRIDFPEYKYIAGVDEAGRGPLAGPVVVASVILKQDASHEMLDDSKKLTEKKRLNLFDWIINHSIALHIEVVPVEAIDNLNILGATMYGMDACAKELTVRPNLILFDGNKTPVDYQVIDLRGGKVIDYDCLSIIKGDSKYACIAAASVLAKVTRDRIMVELDDKYPMYRFKEHKGYPTKKHFEMLEKYGRCEEHRKSFLKGMKSKGD